MPSFIRSLSLVAAVAFVGLATSAPAEDTAAADAATKDMEAMFGFVPSFVKAFPKAGIAGAWAELKGIQLSETTALTVKEKALIGIAVAAQIPCQYCVWLDTKSAYLAGATDEEVQEAVAISALTRHWSTVFNGNQIDFESFKAEFGKMAKASDDMRTKTMAAK